MSVNTANARLCHVIKCDDFDGYGFNLHAEKGKPGQFIGKVDEGSPAETAGLRMGDRILEVNGVSILDENHKQVVQRIKAIPNETKLLVVDPKAEVTAKDTTDDSIKPNSDVDTNSTASSLESPSPTPVSTPVSSKPVPVEPVKIPSPTPTPKAVIPNNNNTSTEKLVTSPQNDSNGKVNGNKLNLPMTAKEFRAQLAAKKKLDPKNQSLDIKSKYDIVQKL